jgi:hypothetical protein
MKRRSFVITLFLSLLGISGFSLIQLLRNSSKDKELAQPKFLSQLCDQSTIQMLGRAYLKLKPDETRDDVLFNNLLAEESQRVFLKKKDFEKAESQIEKRIKHDFDSDNIVVVQGWVLSVTEARQCALYSIINS